MSVAALLLEVAYLTVALVVRAVVQRRRTGDWGLRRPGAAVEAMASATFVAGLAASFAAPILDVTDMVSAADAPDTLRLVGLAVLGLSVVGTFHAQLAMGASWRVGVDTAEETQLVTAGPFRLVRNPIFTYMVLAAVGVLLAVPSALAAAGVVLSMAGAQAQARLVEEPYLLATHGERYRRYAAVAGRFVPGLGRLR
ncbi:MAG TPA: isoprenylcysteine carboxylmethyltransferase family protein [Acidimicrobiia bacterium]|nr:isoprenylcysteine carboxylmethyltransferase family protein [Acidimicrobiia bacterium]